MALIKSQLVLVDGMTAPLRSIHRAMNLALNSFESMQTASGRAVDTRSFQTAREELARMGAQLEEVENQTRRTSGAAESMKSKFMHAAAAVGAALSIKNITPISLALVNISTPGTPRLPLRSTNASGVQIPGPSLKRSCIASRLARFAIRQAPRRCSSRSRLRALILIW